MLSYESMNPRIPALCDRSLSKLLTARAADASDRPFISFPEWGVSWTFGESARDAAHLAAGLREAGLARGDRLGLMLGNRPEFVQAWMASLLAGTVDVAIAQDLVGARLAHQLRTSAVSAVVCDPMSAAAVAAVLDAAPSVNLIITVDQPWTPPGPRVRTVTLHELAASAANCDDPLAPQEISSIRYTSGTTGPAKAVAMSQSRLAVTAAHFLFLTAYGPEDRLYSCFPLHHGIASGLGVVTTLMSGGHMVLERKFSASGFWPSVRRCDATLAHLITPLVPLLMAQPPTPADAEHRCSRLWSAAPNPEFEERFGTKLIYFYGQSEGSVIAYYPPGEAYRTGASGRPSPLFDVRIADDEDYPVRPGVIGEIQWRPREPHIMLPEYYGDPAATVRAWRNLWFHSGDAGYLDSDGYLYLLGRTGDQIRRKGVNISASDIEEAALEYDGVVEAAAIAVPSELGESEVKLCVIPRDGGIELDVFYRHLRSALPAEIMPRYIQLRQMMPHTETYKITKSVLRAEGLTADTVDMEASRRG
jgi:carnitine-CoA ligase